MIFLEIKTNPKFVIVNTICSLWGGEGWLPSTLFEIFLYVLGMIQLTAQLFRRVHQNCFIINLNDFSDVSKQLVQLICLFIGHGK